MIRIGAQAVRFKSSLTIVGLSLALVSGSTSAQEPQQTLCRLLIFEEQVQFEDAALDVDLARADFAAYEEIYALIRGLWEADAIPRMSYLKGKYDYDAARLDLERADLILERQEALVEQYRLSCEGKSRAAIDKAHQRYRKASCDEQAKAIEVATVDLEFNRWYLESVRNLRAAEVATRPDVILAELDVRREERRLADAERRTDACRRAVGETEPEAE
jgi:outer membrane protein TolC